MVETRGVIDVEETPSLSAVLMAWIDAFYASVADDFYRAPVGAAGRRVLRDAVVPQLFDLATCTPLVKA